MGCDSICLYFLCTSGKRAAAAPKAKEVEKEPEAEAEEEDEMNGDEEGQEAKDDDDDMFYGDADDFAQREKEREGIDSYLFLIF